MGIDVDHSLLVGAEYEELVEFFDSKIEEDDTLDHYGVIEEYFTQASPWYDADVPDCFFGFEVPNFCSINDEWFKEVQEKCLEFEVLTGVKAKIRGGANVW